MVIVLGISSCLTKKFTLQCVDGDVTRHAGTEIFNNISCRVNYFVAPVGAVARIGSNTDAVSEAVREYDLP